MSQTSAISSWRRFSEFCSQVANPVLMLSSNYRPIPWPVQIQLTFAKPRQVSRWKALMALRAQSTTRLPSSRLVSVSICLCAFVFSPLPQHAVLTWAESAEGECPCQKDRANSEEETVVWSSARRRLNHRRRSDLGRPRETGDRVHQIALNAGRLPIIVGHQHVNGLRAPLLI